MIHRIFFPFIVCLFLFHISPAWTYHFESCCLNEQTITNNTLNTTRLLSCPLNFVIKLRTVIFYAGNACAPSACQKRLNKHYLPCNNHRTCSISIQCIHMDSSACSTKRTNHSEHLVVDYDCVVHQPEPLLRRTQEHKPVLFSAKINIESPPDLFNDSFLIENENEWKEYLMKKYFHRSDKTIVIQQRSLFSDILRTVIILLIFAFVLILVMLIGLVLYKRVTWMKKRQLFNQEKHQPFPADDAYDNLKATTAESASDAGTTTDV